MQKCWPPLFFAALGEAFFHWFFFALRGARGVACALHIINAGAQRFAWKGWPPLKGLEGDPGFRARLSYDRRNWAQCQETSYDAGSGVLTIAVTPEQDELFVAAFQPYTAADHARFLRRATAADRQHPPGLPALAHPARHRVIGRSLDGAAIDLLEIPGGPSHRR